MGVEAKVLWKASPKRVGEERITNLVFFVPRGIDTTKGGIDSIARQYTFPISSLSSKSLGITLRLFIDDRMAACYDAHAGTERWCSSPGSG